MRHQGMDWAKDLFQWRNKLILYKLNVRTFSAKVHFWVNKSFFIPYSPFLIMPESSSSLRLYSFVFPITFFFALFVFFIHRSLYSVHFHFSLSASCSHPISPSSESLSSPTFFLHVFLMFSYIIPPSFRHKPPALRAPAPAHLLNLLTQFAYFLCNFIRSQSFSPLLPGCI